MIKVGSAIGALNTITITIFTALLGIYFVKQQGISTLRTVVENIKKEENSVVEVVHGFCLIIAAFLLILPGFVTDFFGFLLLVPYTRFWILRNFIPKKREDNDIIEIKPEEIEEHDQFK
tara:strand:- start:62 stop:418 length:357 start_codon:yes stop_codon:yes gene_type:complete